MSQTEAAVRRTGALVALAATSGYVLVFVPTVAGSGRAVLALHAIFLIGCAAVLLSPAHRVVADLAWRAGRVVFGAPATELRTALPFPLPLPAGARATWLTEAGMRRTGALVALAAASRLLLLLLLVPGAAASEGEVLAVYAIFLLGSAAALLSPAHRSCADLARRAAREIQVASSARAHAVLRWAGFTCISFGVISAATDVWAAEKVNGLLLFLLFLAGVWTVSLSMLAARIIIPPPLPLPLWVPTPLPAAEEGCDGGAVKVTVLPAAHGVVDFGGEGKESCSAF